MTAVEYSIIAACLLLAAFQVWKEVQRSNKSRLWLRIIASIVAAVSLIFLAIPLHYNATENRTSKEAALLTEGYNKDSVDAFLKQNKQAVVYSKDEYEQQPNDLFQLHVFGYGLSADEWQSMPASNIIFHPSVIDNGITSIGYNQQINSGNKLIVQGTFNNTTGKSIRITLSGFGVGLDSVIINSKEAQTFELSAIPKFIGRAVYDITATLNKDTLEHEQLPVEVTSSKPLRILLLAAYPDFENKFLQNWLAENNYVVAAKTTISKNKYSYAFTDTTQFSIAQITPTVLQQFDVLIADGAELSSLSKQELFNIKTQVSTNGLGLIIKADSTAKPAVFYDGNCAVAPSLNHNRQTLSMQLPNNDTASTLPVENAVFIKANNSTKALITDTKNNVLACNALYGNGSIVFSTFTNSYYWMLSGDKKSYGLLWSSLIEKAARKEQVNKQWMVQPALPTINSPVQLTAESLSEQPLQSTIENNFIAFAAQPYLPFEWHSVYWPEKKGWQAVVASNRDKFWFYVFDKNDWKKVRSLQSIEDTYSYASSYKKLLYEVTSENKTNKKTIPLFYFFVVFMCCCILLWVEKKLS